MKEFTIGEMGQLMDVSIQTLRYYDRIGLFEPQRVDQTSHYRYYGTNQMFKLNIIKYLRHLGLSIAQIRQLVDADGARQSKLLAHQEDRIEQQIRQLAGLQRLLRGQREQLRLRATLKKQTSGQVYRRAVLPQDVVLLPCQQSLTPADRPDVMFAQLAKLVQESGSIANLQYGCLYDLADYQSLDQVRYRAIFTQVFEPGLATAVRHIPGGTYLCVAFRWSSAHYLTYLQQLVQAYQQFNLPGTPPVYEVSLADGYNYQNDQDFLTELRVKL